MLRQPVCKPRPGLFCQDTREIFRISWRCAIALVITLGTFGPATALGGNSETGSLATMAVFSHTTRPGRPPIWSQRTHSPDARPDPLGDDRVVDQLYEHLIRDCTRVLNGQ